MDTKSLAKSKRAHSQHHSQSRRHDNPNPKPKPKPKPASAKPLHSNWDRYAEEDDPGSENPPRSNDAVLPKSNGADYRHLIAEAQSQPSNLSLSPSLDDALAGEFDRAVGSMLSVRGEGILAWLGDDSFVVGGDQKAANTEASFLCLNLHALAEKLEKIDLSQRLFIESDLLPPELRTEISEASRAQECARLPATNSSVAVRQPTEDLAVFDSLVKVENVDQASVITSSNDSAVRGHDDPSLTLRGFSAVSGSLVQSSMNSSVVTKKDLPKFEAAAAEAELDMLLDSFNEIEILGSSAFSSVDTITVRNETSVVAFEHPRKNRDLSVLTPSNLDNDLDDLLNETSSLLNTGNLLRPETGGVDNDRIVQPSSSKLSGTKSKPLDDFDSWLDTL